MERKNISKIFWTEAMAGGLVTGVAMFLWALIGYWMNLPMKNAGFASLVEFVILIGGIVYFSRRMRDFRGPALGFPYGASFGFVMAMMLFTGFVYGIGQFFLQVVIAPEYFQEVFEMALLNSDMDDNTIDKMLAMYENMGEIMKRPFFMIMGGVFSMVIYGGFIGLVTSAFLKRPANPFADQQNEDYNPEQ